MNLSDEQQYAVDLIQYIECMIRIVNHYNHGPHHDTKSVLLETFSSYDSQKNREITIEEYQQWLQDQCEKLGKG